MTDKAIENAMARRAHTIEQIKQISNDINDRMGHLAHLQAKLADIDNFIRMWHTMVGMEPPQPAEQSKIVEAVGSTKRVRPKNPPREDVAAACVKYIRDAGRPLMRAELLEQLTQDGIIVRGKDPAMVLSTMLWRSQDVIARLKGGGYWPAGEDPPSIGDRLLEDLMRG